jgi:hypothetical protein
MCVTWKIIRVYASGLLTYSFLLRLVKLSEKTRRMRWLLYKSKMSV